MEKIKSIIIASAIIIAVGLIGYIAGRNHFRDATKMEQIDTIVRFDTIRYSRLELTRNGCRLDIPKVSTPEWVYIPSDSTTIIYRDSVRYVTLPRQYYFTETEDAQIWHSGIDSTIDSLVVFRRNMVISKTEAISQKPSPWRYEITVGLDYGWMWQNYITPNVGVEIGYKRISIGAECGLNMDLINNTFQSPMPYLQASIKYRLFGR